MTSTSCEYCFCLKGKETCVKPRCQEPVDPGELEGCTPRYRRLACCPTHYQCCTLAFLFNLHSHLYPRLYANLRIFRLFLHRHSWILLSYTVKAISFPV